MPAGRPVTGINLSTGAAFSVLANGDGSTDDYAILQNALNTCGLIHVPSGRYRLSQGLVFPSVDGCGIIGEGGGYLNMQATYAGTTLLAAFTVGDILAVPTQITHFTLHGVMLDRTSQASQGYGLNMTTGTNDRCDIRDVMSKRSVIGFGFGTTGYGSLEYLIAESNSLWGFEVVGQYQMAKCLAVLNGGDGFRVQGLLGGGNSQGQWTGLSTFGNGGHGMNIQGSSTGTPVHGSRISDSFFGGDGGWAILNDSYSAVVSSYTNIYTEQEPSGGFYVSPNAGDLVVNGCVSDGNVGSGLHNDGPCTMITGGAYTNSTAGHGVLFGSGNGSVIGADLARNAGYGLVAVAGVGAMTYVGNRMNSNSAGPVSDASATPYAAGNW